MTGRIAAAILAAGRGSRFLGDVPKPMALLRGRSLVLWAIDAATASDIGPVGVVVGHAAPVIEPVIPDGVVRIANADWETGMASSVRAAVAWADSFGADAVVIAHADQPLIAPGAWSAIAAASPDAPLVTATYAGLRGHPVRIGRALFAAVAAFEGDEGARVLMGSHSVLEVPCDGHGTPVDVDTVADLARFESDVT